MSIGTPPRSAYPPPEQIRVGRVLKPPSPEALNLKALKPIQNLPGNLGRVGFGGGRLAIFTDGMTSHYWTLRYISSEC